MKRKKSLKARYIFLGVFTALAAAVLLGRLVEWQLFQSEYYENISATSASYTVKTDAVRGEIFDKNGVELAVNITGYKIVINKIYISDDEINDCIVRLVNVMDECGEKWEDTLPIIIGKDGGYSFDNEKTEDVVKLKSKDRLNMNPYSTADECIARLTAKYNCQSYNKVQQRNIASVRYNMENSGYSYTVPYIFAKNISEKTMLTVSEKMQDIKGITVESTALRTYKNGTTAPHIVGITGLISAEEYKEMKSQGYGYTDIIGKNGVESAFESYLRGKEGSRTFERSSDGKVSLLGIEKAQPGNSVYLTIDTRYQKVAQKALADAVTYANNYSTWVGDKYQGGDCVGAALVMLNVKDFSVLCAASYPTYDLAKYYDDYTKLANDEAHPLFDRAFMGALAPGSTFKPMIASAALQEKKITTDTYIDCERVYTENGLNLWCMGYHGWIDVYHAIEDSCNVFFAETGRRLGIENLQKYAKRCGLGVKTGVETGESSGTLAGPEYSQKMGTQWNEADVSPAAIGQSDNQFTPLQLATYAATIANNGVRLKTHVVDRVVSYDGKEVIYKSEPVEVDNMGVSKENLKEVQKAMNMAANAYGLINTFDIQIAAKTGTAETNGSDHSNFICYAPYDDPQIAIAVMIEHGSESYTAMSTARTMLDAYFHGIGLE